MSFDVKHCSRALTEGPHRAAARPRPASAYDTTWGIAWAVRMPPTITISSADTAGR